MDKIAAQARSAYPYIFAGSSDREHKFGYNGDVGSLIESLSDLGGGLYAYLSAATTLTLSSSSADDAAAGTGARTVQIYGLDGNYNPINEIVTLNGQNGVTTVNSYLRIYRGVVRSAGSGEQNAGDIYAGTGTITAGVPATQYLKISATENQTLMALWTVPAGRTFHMKRLFVSSFGNQNVFATARFVARPLGEVFQVKEKFTVTRGFVNIVYDEDAEYGEKTDLEIRGVSSGADVDLSAFFSGLVLE